MLTRPGREFGLQARQPLGLLALPRSPLLPLAAQRREYESVVGLHPALDVEHGVQDSLEAKIVLLRKRLKLVVVALGALDRQRQERRDRIVHRRLQSRVSIDADLVRIAVALARSVLAIPQEVRGLEQLDLLGGGLAGGREAG